MLLVETRKEASHSDAMQFLGTGWQRKLFARKTGSRFDINIISPEGKRFREYSRLVKYLKRTRNKVVQEKEVEQLRQLFRMDGLNSSVKKPVIKTSVIRTNPKPSIQTSKKERKILPKDSDLTESQPMQDQLLKLNSSQFLLEKIPQEKHQLIFLSPRSIQIPQKVTETIILEPEWTKIKSNSDFHHKEIAMAELKSCVVASPNMFVSQDLNVLVDTELEVTCDIADMEEKDDISYLCVHDLSYFDDFILSKPKGDMNPTDEKTEEHCTVIIATLVKCQNWRFLIFITTLTSR